MCDAALPGSVNLLLEGGSTNAKDGKRALRRSRSHAGLLTSLVQRIKDPARNMSNTAGSAAPSPNKTAPAADQERKQVLYLRMRNVRPELAPPMAVPL
jgi:hypothetical protein